MSAVSQTSSAAPEPPIDRASVQGALERFRQRWEAREGIERQQAQQFLRDLLECYGQNVGEHDEAFEYRLIIDGTQKYADLLLPEQLLVEMKGSKETDQLERHYGQAEAYWRAAGAGEHKSPRFVVLCSFRRMLIYQPGEHPGKVMADLRLGDLVERPEVLDFLRGREPDLSSDQIDLAREAVGAVADLHHGLLVRGVDAETARSFVLQATWCMFAEDLGLLSERVLTEVLAEMARTPALAEYDPIGDLFAALGQEDPNRAGRYQHVPYANGGLFEQPARVVLLPEEAALLRKAAQADWTKVEPAVFGGFLQSSIDARRRQQIGAHYTPKRKIDRIVQPTIVTPWRRRIDALGSSGEAVQLIEDLSQFKVLDPACGCGNFLYVTYDALRGLEADARARLAELCAAEGRTVPEDLPRVPLSNMLGIDVDTFAVRLARVVLWIGHAMAVERHHLVGEAVLPLPEITTITEGDALELDWPECDAIVGNPPFIGSQHLREHIGDEAVERLKLLFPGVGIREYVTYWFRKAHDHLGGGERAGFVATNSIREGRARQASLEYVTGEGGTITDAVSSIPWEGEANVHVSIVNWVKGQEAAPFGLDDREVESISPSLTEGDDHTPPVRLAGNAGRSFQGPIPVGKGFELDEQEAKSLLARTDAQYSHVVRPYLKGKDITDDPRQGPRQWIIDFADRPLEEAMRYSAALDLVRARVKPDRDENRDAGFRDRWWQFGRVRMEMRNALAPLPRYVVANEYGKRIQFAWQQSQTCPNNKTVAVASADPSVLGLLVARPFTLWTVRWGGRLKADLHFTPTTVFETYPFPPVDTAKTERIGDIADELIALRSELCLTGTASPIGLTKLYNLVDEGAFKELSALHHKLDEAVLDAYGWPRKLAVSSDDNDRELLGLLYARNQSLTNGAEPDYEAFPLTAEHGTTALF
ncbi:MAG TPA: hypothetical protein PKB03_05935 [Baekduia sp.]|nr:hypothetical protein [Baekduia sp.]